jgi:hypothetical protein
MNPAYPFPEFNPTGIVIEDEYMTFLDAFILYNLQTLTDQLTRKTLSSAIRMHRKMVDIATSAVMTT